MPGKVAETSGRKYRRNGLCSALLGVGRVRKKAEGKTKLPAMQRALKTSENKQKISGKRLRKPRDRARTTYEWKLL
jgi:hypothetical protein